MSGPYAFTDLSAGHFPFDMEGIGPDGEIVWSIHVDAPGAIRVPGAPDHLKGKVAVKMTWNGGESWCITYPDGSFLDNEEEYRSKHG